MQTDHVGQYVIIFILLYAEYLEFEDPNDVEKSSETYSSPIGALTYLGGEPRQLLGVQ